ncbi:glycosyltransferase [Chryseobacterium potabilaquae]|uniref:N-acetylgalactosamine-N, N'-diacetylbacillosaminyl-diphospho-undecaprenol 4-alpha-N-acetylgalactosaminyltransferase n=1 Tax=Chryseobacterium potabilaquae TaxID=2675057 RepID=A0A6N4X4K0_9FLAO|nr:glycosyltransferase [Chryseobacterium potabilaquae]CAA7194383.1 N-acetylgalactosamine-N, N'-diacetylbacillosaminyl-diphospho-undecaprenol 4-alpha-N-acetylgalactosaminyltransferase [Chryseobacterium potabilaquae]
MTTNTKKIKILFRHRSMEMGGVEKVLLSILNNINPNIFDMTVCLTLNQGELRNEFPSHVKKIYLTDGKENFSKNSILRKIQLISRRIKLKRLDKNRHIIDKIINDTFDIEIGMDYRDYDAVLNSTNKNSKKIGWSHSEINVPKLKPLVPYILNSFPKFDHIIYCSVRIKEMMHHYHPELKYPPESIIINAIPIEEIKKKAGEKIDAFPSVPTFVSIGRLHTRKGFHKLIDAHTQLMKEGLIHHIIILGDGEERENLQSQIRSNGVENSFILAGNKMNPYPYIKNADYFILPSESEAWPLVIAEALILQKPIIATNVGDIGMMIKDRETGYLINYDTTEMYHAMKEFISNQELTTHIREKLKNIESQFDNKKIFDEIEQTLINLAKK